MMTKFKQRTVSNMKPIQRSRARWLWATMQDAIEGPEFEQARDDYHAMFEDDSNFKGGVAPRESAVKIDGVEYAEEALALRDEQ